MYTEENVHYVRWYDHYPNLKVLMQMVQTLPLPQQREIGEQLLSKTMIYQEMADMNTQLKSLGMDTIIALHKSKRKLRWYDRVPELHEALNILRGFSVPVLTHFDNSCTRIVNYLYTQQKRAELLNRLDTQALFNQRRRNPFAESVSLQVRRNDLVLSR